MLYDCDVEQIVVFLNDFFGRFTTQNKYKGSAWGFSSS